MLHNHLAQLIIKERKGIHWTSSRTEREKDAAEPVKTGVVALELSLNTLHELMALEILTWTVLAGLGITIYKSNCLAIFDFSFIKIY